MSQATRPAFSALSPASRSIWAKSGDGAGHGLLAHLLDVAAVAETLLGLEPESTLRWAAAQFGLPPRHAGRWLAAVVGLHDFGKAIPGFQAKWAEGMQADQAFGLPFPSSACGVTEHALATAALLGRDLHVLAGAEANWLRHVVQAISAHHGYHFLPAEVNGGRPRNEPTEWSRERKAILDAYWQVIAPEDSPARDELTLPAVNWLAGLASIADWIASNPEWFPQGERRDDLHDYYQEARRLADQALHGIGWRQARALLETPSETVALLARIVGRDGLSARPLQEAGDQLLRSARGPALLLVEAPMGEGKTELAFLADLRPQAVNKHRGLYVALLARVLETIHNRPCPSTYPFGIHRAEHDD